MQRTGNVGSSGGGYWSDGTANYNLPQVPVPIQQMPLSRINPNPGIMPQDDSTLLFPRFPSSKPTWGQHIDDPTGTKIWNTDSGNSKGLTDRAVFLGTKQWGRESGGAPWGQTSPTEKSPAGNQSLPMSSSSGRLSGGFGTSETTTTPGIGLTSHSPVSTGLGFNIAEYVLGGSVTDTSTRINPVTYGSGSDSRSSNNGGSGSSSQFDSSSKLQTLTSADKTSTSDNPRTSSSRETSPTEEELKSQRQQSQLNNRMSPNRSLLNRPSSSIAVTSSSNNGGTGSESLTAQTQSSDNLTTEGETAVLAPASLASTSTSSDSGLMSEQQMPSFPVAGDVEFGEGQSTSTSSIDGAIQQQMSQLSLDYNAQQQSLAVHLAMQQQYMLAAQQQQLAAMPGVFLPNPYIIAAPNTGYPDPTTAAAAAGQFPIMPQYPAYAAWPNMAYPSMITSQMAASTVSSQQSNSPTSVNQSVRTTQSDMQSSQRLVSPSSASQLQGESSDVQNSVPQPPVYPDLLANAAFANQPGINPMTMSGSGYQMIPTAYYDQTGALIVNNGRYGGPVRLFAPGVPGPMFMNGSQPSHTPNLYASPTISGGSTPVPAPSQGPGGAYTPVGPHGSFGGFGSGTGLGSLGSLGSGIGSSSSTPQRRDSFSDYGKPYSGPISQFYNSYGMSGGGGMGIGAISPSPGPLGSMIGAAPSHHSMSPPPLSSPSSFFGGNSRMFSAAPGAEAKFRNGSVMSPSIFGNSGSSLFPPTRIRPMPTKDMLLAAGRSRLLDDFRNNRFPNPQLRDLANHIVEFSRDQHGSRFIQQKLERATLQEKQLVFNEIAGAAYQLMTDVFGNYVIQKFFEFGSPEQKLALAKCIRGHVLPLALQMYGCRVIQKALECIPTEEQVEIVKELDGHLIKCVKDQNGNHVVQKCIECVPHVHLQFIIDAFKGQVILLSMHPYGCRVMQRILEHCTQEQTLPILEELHQHADTLVTDQYGNYVIQHILEHGRPENKCKIVNGLRGQVLKLSQHKFASNVVEKCVSHSGRVERALLIEEACQEPDALLIMMKDQYANYVVQKMLDVAEPQHRNMLIAKIRPHNAQLRKFTYGKHIIAKLEKFLMKNQQPSAGGPAPLHSGVGTPTVVLPRDMQSNVLLPNNP